MTTARHPDFENTVPTKPAPLYSHAASAADELTVYDDAPHRGEGAGVFLLPLAVLALIGAAALVAWHLPLP